MLCSVFYHKMSSIIIYVSIFSFLTSLTCQFIILCFFLLCYMLRPQGDSPRVRFIVLNVSIAVKFNFFLFILNENGWMKTAWIILLLLPRRWERCIQWQVVGRYLIRTQGMILGCNPLDWLLTELWVHEIKGLIKFLETCKISKSVWSIDIILWPICNKNLSN